MPLTGKYDQEMPHLQTSPRHREEETKNTNSHIAAPTDGCFITISP